MQRNYKRDDGDKAQGFYCFHRENGPVLVALGTLPQTDPEVKAADNVMVTEETPHGVWHEIPQHHSDCKQ